MQIKINQIPIKSEDYNEELNLRNEVLRKPLGRSLFDENLDAEIHDFHIGAYSNQKLIAVLVLTKIDNNTLKMRQVAVDQAFQSQKVGSQLVIFAENFAKKSGYNTLVLNARSTAAEFYTKLGYKTISDEFTEVGIPHFKMKKTL